MTAKNLKEVCMSRFPETGRRLFEAMEKVIRADFCVATSWEDHDVSIAKSCTCMGIVFRFNECYSALYLPDNTTVSVNQLDYAIIASHLPKRVRNSEQKNCSLDLKYFQRT